MLRLGRLLLPVLLLALGACASPPPPPPARVQVDRLLQQGARQFDGGRLEEARRSFQAAVSASELVDDMPSLVQALLAQGACALQLGRPDLAEASYGRALAEARRENLPESQPQARAGLAEAWRRSGRTGEAAEAFRALLGQPGLAAPVRLSAANGLALALLGQGEIEAAEKLLLEIAPSAREVSEPLQAVTLANLARLALARQQTGLALERARQALEIDRRRYFPPGIAADHALLADILEAAGQGEAARPHRQSAERIQGQTGQVPPR